MQEQLEHRGQEKTAVGVIPSLLKRFGELFKGEKDVTIEVIQFNKQQIDQAVEKLLAKTRKTSKLGAVASEQLEIKDQKGNIVPCQLRYLVVKDANEIWGYDESLAYRLELFAGNLPAPEDYSFSPNFSEFEEYADQGLKPVAFRQNYFIDLPDVDLINDGLSFSGISYTIPAFNRLGIGTAFFKNVNAQPMLQDFVRRTKRFWSAFDIPKEVKSASFLIADSTFNMAQSTPKQLGWTERRIKELGLEPADPQKYPTVGHEPAYIQKIFFS